VSDIKETQDWLAETRAENADLRRQVATLECAVAALREGLEPFVEEFDSLGPHGAIADHMDLCLDISPRAYRSAKALLADPNPGAGVQAVVDAAIALVKHDEMAWNCAVDRNLVAAVRALDKHKETNANK